MLQKIRCVTSFITFQNTCTDRDVLIMEIKARCDIRADVTIQTIPLIVLEKLPIDNIYYGDT